MATTDLTGSTREVLNQAPPLQPINLFESDLALPRRSRARAAAGASTGPARPGAVAGSAEAREHGRRAERNLPRS